MAEYAIGFAPSRRDMGLVVRELDDEVLVYDLDRHVALCLNRTSALVWQQCDGETSIETMRQTVEEALGAPVDEHTIWLALSQLNRDHLLAEPEGLPAVSTHGITRRQMLTAVGVAAVTPFIASITAPVAAASGATIPCPGSFPCVPHSSGVNPCQNSSVNGAPCCCSAPANNPRNFTCHPAGDGNRTPCMPAP